MSQKKEQLRKQIMGLIKQYGDLNTQEQEGVFMPGRTVIPPSGKVNGSRLLFAGNLVKQPYMSGRQFRVSGSLDNTNNVMNNTFWVGIYPGLGNEQIEYMGQELARIVRK